MKLPCPIQALVGSDGVYVTVVAKSHVNPGAVFSETWSAVDETRRTGAAEENVQVSEPSGISLARDFSTRLCQVNRLLPAQAGL